MPRRGSTVLGSAGFVGDDFGAGFRGFFAAVPALRLAPAPFAPVFRPTFLVALLLVLFLAINASSFRGGRRRHIAHRRRRCRLVRSYLPTSRSRAAPRCADAMRLTVR